MIQGFEEITAELSTYEVDLLVPIITEGLKTKVGAKNAIRSKKIAEILDEHGYPGIKPPRIRKCVNYIRRKGLVPHLVANSNGYYVATSVEEVEKYAESLEQRASAILSVKKSLTEQLTGKIFL